MNVGEQIKQVRAAKGLSQKEVTLTAGLDKAQYSRIENGKTDPSISTLQRIAQALGVSLSELFASPSDMEEVQSVDKSVMEKVTLIENLSDQERQTIYFMLDSFLGKKKLKDVLSNVLKDVE